MSQAVFNRLYKGLNQRQREAVDALQGPVMVIAGPGTGKTSILTLRIANLLARTDASPDSILALTFTESGAYSMRRKLVEVIGGAAYRVGIFTFHGFANYLISRFEESFPRIVGGRSAALADQARILEEIFARNRFKLIRPFGDIFYYVPKALRAIHELKREGISPAEFADALKREARRLSRAPERVHARGRFRGQPTAAHRDRLRRIEKSRELAEVYAAYEKALARERLFDFEDMLLEAIRALEKDEGLLRTLQEQYQYILADEHQDANNAQNALLELLCSFDDSPNLFIVGDEKQAIYRFQGASLENFLYFRRLYPKALLINLSENYRSSQSILDAAHSLMEKGTPPSLLPLGELRPRLLAKRAGERKSVRFFEFSRPSAEVAFVVSDVEKRLSDGASPREIALFVRDNEDALPFAEALEKTAVPHSVLADADMLSDETQGKLLLILRAVSEPGNPTRFAEMLHVDFLGVPPLALYELLQFCEKRRRPLFAVLKDARLRREAHIGESEAILRVFSDFERWARLARNKGAGEVVETIARESGFVRDLLSRRGSLRSLEGLDALFARLKELSARRRVFRLADFLETLVRLQRHGLRLSARSPRPEFYDSVTLMTAHRAKGLEFDVVYILNAVDGHWGGRRARTDFYIPAFLLSSAARRVSPTAASDAEAPEDEDERRLFYVALTRARKEVLITMAREKESGRQALPSQFVEDIDSPLLSREKTEALEARMAKRAPLYLKERINAGPSVAFREYLRKVFLEQGLTVTALNNYLSCPWEYFFKNLVRLPKLPEPYLSYGTAVHAALYRFFERLKKRRASKAELLRLFERELEKSPLPLREFEEYLRRGRAALSGYFDARKGAWQADTVNECEIQGVFVPLERGERLLLRGVLDKIERNPDGTVTVVDYKTGRPRSRAQMLGETKSSEGNLKRQLDFYKLLLSRSEGAPGRRGAFGRMTAGVIEFVEPDAKGVYRREVFEITEEDAEAVQAEAVRAGREIYHFEFWNKRCADRRCEYCRLREFIA